MKLTDHLEKALKHTSVACKEYYIGTPKFQHKIIMITIQTLSNIFI